MKKKNSKKSKAVLTAPLSRDAISYQISIKGPRAWELTKEQANNLTLRALNGDSTAPYHVRIKMWRGGHELDWSPQASVASETRASILRANLRRALQQGRVNFRKVGKTA